ncbi:MAG TPA: glycosyltransferase [Gammaproteobacteria bacterium]|nr:glycosyltransferase [Gammaproteobacteria bacterium]
MRVLHVFKLYLPFRGGIISVIEVLTKGLRGQVDACVLVAAERGLGGTEVVDGVPVRRTSSAGQLMALPVAPTLPLWFWSGARRADIVDYHYPFPLADLAISLWFPAGTALVVHWHSDIVAQRRTGRLLAPFIRRCLRRADRIIVATPFHIEQSPILRDFRSKCEVVPYGINVAEWISLEPAQLRRIEQLRERQPRLVLAVGRLVPYKGFENLIRAMPRVDGHLTIVGTGPLRSELQRLAETIGVGARVTFEDDATADKLKTLMHACRLLVLPSVGRNEAFGMVQLEAMACAKPVVNTSIHGGVAWVARDGQEGLTVPPDDVEALSRAITRLLDDPDEARRMGEQGYARVCTEFTLERFTERTLAVYRDVLVAHRQ